MRCPTCNSFMSEKNQYCSVKCLLSDEFDELMKKLGINISQEDYQKLKDKGGN